MRSDPILQKNKILTDFYLRPILDWYFLDCHISPTWIFTCTQKQSMSLVYVFHDATGSGTKPHHLENSVPAVCPVLLEVVQGL